MSFNIYINTQTQTDTDTHIHRHTLTHTYIRIKTDPLEIPATVAMTIAVLFLNKSKFFSQTQKKRKKFRPNLL